MDYTNTETRAAPLFSRVTRADQALVRAAAEGLSLSSYIAVAVTRKARRDLSAEPQPEEARDGQD